VINTEQRSEPGRYAANDNGSFNSNVIVRRAADSPDRLDKDNLTHYINAAAFSRRRQGTYGNSGRACSAGRPVERRRVDLQDFTITERFRLRSELRRSNILNHANFALATDTSTSLNMNRRRSDRSPARQ